MKEDGYTLIEVVIAAALMALSITMVIGTLVLMKRSVQSSNDRLAALHETRNQMETLLSLPYTNAQLSLGSHSFASASGSFTGFYSVATNSTFPGIKNVTLTIYWKNPGMVRASSNTITSSMSEPLH